MDMPFDFIQPGLWTFAFFGAIFTATAGWPYALAAIWWLTITFLAVHREDAPDKVFDFHAWWLISVTSGLVTDFSLLYSLRLDRFIDTNFHNYRNNKRYTSLEFHFIVLFATITYAGYFYLTGAFSDGFGGVPLSVARPVGVTMLVVGILGLLATFIWCFANSTDRRESTLNAKYILALMLGFIAAPTAYDFAHAAGLQPWHGLITLGAIALYWLLMIFWIGYTYVDNEGTLKFGKWEEDGGIDRTHLHDRFYSRKQLNYFLLFGFLTQFVFYIVVWIVDTLFKKDEPTAVEPVVTAIGITSFVLSLILLVLYFFGQDFWPSATKRRSVKRYDYHRKVNASDELEEQELSL